MLARLIEVHGDLFLDDVAFFVDFGGIEVGVEKHVGEDIEEAGEVFGAGFGVEAGVLFAGEGVEIAAEAFDGF